MVRLRRGRHNARSIPVTRFSVRDVPAESSAGMPQRPARSLPTSMGTVLGVGTFVAVLGLTSTASSQTDKRFSALSATEVTIEDVARDHNEFGDLAFPADGEQARGRHITTQFLTESATLGALGGLVGTSLGAPTVVGVAIARDWTPVIHSMTVTTPAIGLATGLPAGLYPAWRASRITPVEALRR
ncbi:ABC transporter permease [Streptomyces sp. NBC_00250]|nr:ABC transporter permease [Streptomyces sp. NBC_00250]